MMCYIQVNSKGAE